VQVPFHSGEREAKDESGSCLPGWSPTMRSYTRTDTAPKATPFVDLSRDVRDDWLETRSPRSALSPEGCGCSRGLIVERVWCDCDDSEAVGVNTSSLSCDHLPTEALNQHRRCSSLDSSPFSLSNTFRERPRRTIRARRGKRKLSEHRYSRSPELCIPNLSHVG
jgi:hypothetical protein